LSSSSVNHELETAQLTKDRLFWTMQAKRH
jgi:hypothetical protein